MCLSDDARECQSALVTEVDVEKSQIEGLRAEGGKRLGDRASEFRRMTGRLEHTGREPPHVRLIVDDQDVHGREGGAIGRATPEVAAVGLSERRGLKGRRGWKGGEAERAERLKERR